ncbi:MAG: hypothetical protein ACRDG6_11255 [Candidatus Limnocylindria bacterium]
MGVEQWAELRRRHFVQGTSIRQLQRDTGLDFTEGATSDGSRARARSRELLTEYWRQFRIIDRHIGDNARLAEYLNQDSGGLPFQLPLARTSGRARSKVISDAIEEPHYFKRIAQPTFAALDRQFNCSAVL